MQEQPKAPAAGLAPPAPPPPAPPPRAGAPPRRGIIAQPPGILFDSDMGRNVDAALALAVLYSLGPKGHLVAVGISNSSLEAAAWCDAVGRFYTGDPVAQSSGNRGVLPVGLAEDGPRLVEAPMFSYPFHHDVKDVSDTADVRVLYRNALLTQKDGEGSVVLAGPATNLVGMLDLNLAKDIVAAKAGVLIAALGTYPEGPADPRVKADLAAARQLFARWPTPIVAVGTELGAALPYPGRSIETDFAWSPSHPVAEAYRANKAMPYDAPGQAVVAALYAGNQKADYFQLSEPGTIEVLDDGRTRFVPSPSGRHRYLKVDAAQRERVQKAFMALAATKPAPPPARGFRGGQAAQQQQQQQVVQEQK